MSGTKVHWAWIAGALVAGYFIGKKF